MPKAGTGTVFGGTGEWSRLDNLRLHDLRHTVASYAVMSGENLPLVESYSGTGGTGTVDARPFQGLCMGDLRVVPPRNISDFPGHSQLFLICYAEIQAVMPE